MRKEQQQAIVEARMAEAGKLRALTNLTKHLTRHDAVSTPAGIAMTRRSIAPVVVAIKEWLAFALAGKGGTRNTAAVLLEGVDPELAAYIAVKTAISAAHINGTLRSQAQVCGEALDGELRAARFEDANPGLYHAIVNACADRGTTGRRVVHSLNKAARKFCMDLPGWTTKQKVLLGTALLEIVAAHVNVVVIRRADGGGLRAPYRIYFGPGAAKWFDDFNNATLSNRPVYLPSILSPVPWHDTLGGGYHTSATAPYPLITGARAGQLEALEEGDMSRVYSALNLVQDTSWRVNAAVLEVLHDAWTRGLTIGGIPSRDDEPVIPMPDHIAALPNDDKRRADWKRTMRDTHSRNALAASKRYTFDRRIRIAVDFCDYDEFYFPYHCDFRGRFYPRCEVLSPQGDDVSRSLLEFAEGKPLGDQHGPKWFAIHGANTFGFDKASFADREAWAFEHSAQMTACARDPLTNLWWTEADKPWSFLAFCFEWQGYMKNGFDHVSRLPIALDGTCNGLQHFAAMLRDRTTGEAVNLVPADVPNDIYARVAEAVTEAIKLVPLLDEKRWIADGWLAFGVNRKLTKRPVMVLPYGGTFRSCQQYVIEAFDERLANGEGNPFPGHEHAACTYLAGFVWRAMGDVVIAGREAMAYIQAVARCTAQVNAPLAWVAPSGFHVRQMYVDMKERRIETRFNGTIRTLQEQVPTDKVDRRSQAAGASPNFVHSLDAAAMVLTINAAAAQGVTHFAMIHDSYGAHACDTEALATTLREEFVRMYQEHDVLAELLATAMVVAPTATDWPTPPARGDLDLELVKESKYFFA